MTSQTRLLFKTQLSGFTFTCSCFVFPEDVFLMSSKDPKNPVIYAVFTTSRYAPIQISSQ